MAFFTGRTTVRVQSCLVGKDFLNQTGGQTCSVVAQGRQKLPIWIWHAGLPNEFKTTQTNNRLLDKDNTQSKTQYSTA